MSNVTLITSDHIQEASRVSDPIVPLSLLQLCKGAILVMDDDATLRDLFRIMLDALGYTSVCVREGAEAVRLYKQAQRDGRPFAGVILDLHNALGAGGIDTIAALRELDPTVNAIICSGDQDAPAMRRFHAYGFHNALVKPFDLVELDKRLKDAFTLG